MSHPPRISCIALISKQNTPLYLKPFPKTPSTPPTDSLATHTLPGPSASLKYHFLAHSALDIIEERILSGQKTIDTYFGLLHVLEEVSVYGFLTNSLVKILVMVEGGDGSGGLRDSDVKLVMRKVHDEYVKVVFNPFYIPGENKRITSSKFDREIERIAREWKPTI